MGALGGGDDSLVGGVRKLRKTITFTGAAGAGAVGTVTVATVTGTVYIHRVAHFITTTLTDAGNTAALVSGFASDTDGLSASATTDAMVTNDFWTGAGTFTTSTIPTTATGGASTSATTKVTSENIILTVANEAVTGGVMEIVIWWEPIGAGSSLV